MFKISHARQDDAFDLDIVVETSHTACKVMTQTHAADDQCRTPCVAIMITSKQFRVCCFVRLCSILTSLILLQHVVFVKVGGHFRESINLHRRICAAKFGHWHVIQAEGHLCWQWSEGFLQGLTSCPAP